MSVQGVFNTKSDRGVEHVGGKCVCAVYGVSCVHCGMAVCGQNIFSRGARRGAKIFLLGGAMGAFITLTVIKSMDALGPAKAVMLIVIAQLIIAYLIELFGMFGVEKQPFSWRKVIGALIAIGICAV